MLTLVREQYADFGPTLAAEKVAARHGLHLGVETLRQWMIAAGLWIDRRHRLPSPHQPRRRHECMGELIQIDGSEHAWFEDRGPTCTLLAFIDDATSRIIMLRFVTSESVFVYFRAMRLYLETHGKPVAFYSDKHSIFRVNSKDAAGGDRITQFSRALAELNIDIICANVPQAKGRVEPANDATQTHLAHQACHGAASHRCALAAELPAGFAPAINPEVYLKDAADLGAQPGIALGPHRCFRRIAPLCHMGAIGRRAIGRTRQIGSTPYLAR